MKNRNGLALLATVVAAAPALASGEGGGGISLISPSFGLMFWTVLTFLILAFLLGKLAWKPLMGAMAEREKSIEDSLAKAAEEREAADKLLEEHRALIAEAHRERAKSLEASQKEGERLKAEILDEARKQREQLLKQTEEQVQAGMRQAESKLRGVAVDLAIQAAEKLLVENLDDSTQRKLVEDYLAELEDGSSGSTGPPS
jgi:F-type H+-transporting ATPase subunit b